MSTGEDVARQLSADYPPDSLGWVKKLTWDGPKEIPLDTVDFSNKKNWNAWHEPARVSKFAAKIHKRAKQGRRIKPVVLVDTPATDPSTNLKVIDGHHRSLAYQKLGKPVWGYVAKTPKTVGPWDEFHAAQRHESEGGTSEFAAKVNGEVHNLSGSQSRDGSKTPSWQAWEQDREHAQQLADNLQAALLGAVDTHTIATEWATIVNNGATGPGEVEGYLMAKLPSVRLAVEQALGPAWQQAWELGTAAAQHQLQAAKTAVADLTKVGPHGYIHGWIYVGPDNITDPDVEPELHRSSAGLKTLGGMLARHYTQTSEALDRPAVNRLFSRWDSTSYADRVKAEHDGAGWYQQLAHLVAGASRHTEHGELYRGITLSTPPAGGQHMDIPLSDWTEDPETAHQFGGWVLHFPPEAPAANAHALGDEAPMSKFLAGGGSYQVTRVDGKNVYVNPVEAVTTKASSRQAWEQDREHAQHLADNLQAALIGAVDTRQIAQEWADHPTP